MVVRTIALACFTAVFCFSNPTIINLPANSWYKVPNSKMRPVCATTASSYGCWAVYAAWNGGAYDPNGRELLVFGGGHNDYDGNEVYAFSTDSLKWRRVTNPSYPSNRCNNVNSDGTPVSRHSYNGLGFITHANRFFALGGALDCAGGGCGANETWTFDVAAKRWYRMQPSGTIPSTGCGDNCCYDPVSQKLYFHTQSGLHAYHFATNAWASANNNTNYYYRTSCVDTKRRLIVEVGGGSVNTYNLNTSLTMATLTTTGGSAIVSGSNSGLDYDVAADRVVGYRNGSVYVLDMDTRVWTVNTPSGGPLNNTVNGTYGRWRYAPDVNAFVLAVDVDSSVYFYKLTAGSGIEKASLSSPAGFSAFPNPFRHEVTFKGNAVAITIHDLSGRVVSRLNCVSEATWKPGPTSAGLYLVRAEMNGKSFVKTIFLEK